MLHIDSKMSLRTTCEACGIEYVRKHTCHAGTCTMCQLPFRNLTTHKCAVRKCMEYLQHQTLDRIRDAIHTIGNQCEACGAHFPVIKNIYRPRLFKHILLCADCYDVPEIRRESSMRFDHVLMDDIFHGKIKCHLCMDPLIDPMTLRRIRYFERDHIDPSTKTMSVGLMCLQGAPLDQIIAENRLCRNLCISCHSIVTYVERQSGCLQACVRSSALQQEVQTMASEVAVSLSTTRFPV